jgi:hypothetical protein
MADRVSFRTTIAKLRDRSGSEARKPCATGVYAPSPLFFRPVLAEDRRYEPAAQTGVGTGVANEGG